MIIVITSERKADHEIVTINQMFYEGLNFLHIRKPFIDNHEMKALLNQINPLFHSQLVLHSHYDLGKEYNISRIHIREADRLNGLYKKYIGDYMLSTSVHDINTYNMLGKEWEYSFISPVFPSISKKGYGEKMTVIQDIKYRNNPDVKLIALGGIDENNIRKAFDGGADGAALLGSVWKSVQPLDVLKKCRANVLL